MSDLSNHHRIETEHGTMTSYIIGFILSLLFTIIPYYLVVHKTITGTPLLLAIMSFAVAQMIIQITFFLHLGRGPKPKWNLFFFVSTVGIILVVVGGSIIIINNLHYNMQPSDQIKKIINDEAIYQVGGVKTGACQSQHTNHIVIIKNGLINPVHTDANLCDTMTYKNEDDVIRDMAFGEHPNHSIYAGESEMTVQKQSNKTFTLSETGSYKFHDHFHEETAGTFTVLP